MLVESHRLGISGPHIKCTLCPNNCASNLRRTSTTSSCISRELGPHKSHVRTSCQRPTASSTLSIATLVWLQGAYQSCIAAEVADKYVPGPVEVGPEIWVGTIAACVPFVIGSWEFGKRIIIQRRCTRCQGSGLVMRGQFARKCPECGGFFPWQGWWKFFTSTAAPGNGGPLRAPRGQTSVFYKIAAKRRVPPQSKNGQGASTDAERGSAEDASVRIQQESIEERG